MAIEERLKDFPDKTSPTKTDIVYVGDSADGFEEVQATIDQIINGYSLALASLASLVSSADKLPYFSGVNNFSLTSFTAFARSILDDPDGNAVLATIGGTPLSGGTMTGPLILSGDPVNALQAATKQYVDAISMGISVHAPCYAATTANLAGYTYSNGASGVGATLTAGSNGAFSADGQLPGLNARILVKDQSTTFQNGVYTLSTVGDGSNPAVLTRATDFDSASENIAGAFLSIQVGTVNAGTQWVQTATVVTIGTDPIVFASIGAFANAGANSNITSMTGGSGSTLLAFALAGNTQPNQPSFQAYVTSTSAAVTGDGTAYTIASYTENYDIGNNFNASTGVFTAPKDGTYIFYASVIGGSIGAGNTRGLIYFNASGGLICDENWAAIKSTASLITRNGTLIKKLSNGDQVSVGIQETNNGSKNVTVVGGAGNTTFGGFFLG